MAYLLDTNIVSDLIRNPNGIVAARLADIAEDEVFTSIIVAAELRYGAARKKSPRLTAQVETVLSGLEIIPFDTPTDIAYAKLRGDLESQGLTIGANDLFIAAHALALNHTLVTGNEREFSRIPGLIVENWLR